MSILEGGVRFPVDPLLLRILSFYELSLDQCLPNFYRVVNCVGRLNRLYGLNLTHHDINFLYAIWGSLKHGSYLQTRNIMVRLISCLPNSNKNSAGEYVRVSGNWLNGELTYPTSLHQIGWYFLFPTLWRTRVVLPHPFSPLAALLFHVYMYYIIIIIIIFSISLTRTLSPTVVSRNFNWI